MVCQTRGILDYTEQDMYQAEFTGGNILNIFNWDIAARDYLYAGGYYPSRGTLLRGDKNYLIGASLKNAFTYENPLHQAAPLFPITHKSQMAVLAQKLNKSNFISELNNFLIGWHQKGTVTVKAHSGATIDFDSVTPTIGSEAETANVVISNAHSLFTLMGYSTYYQFNAGSDLDKDFIEIALTGKTIQGRNAYVAISGTQTGIKRVQVIGFKSAGNPDIFNSVISASDINSEKVFVFPLPSTTYTSMAIRLIGCRQTSDVIYINDIAVERGGVTEGHNFVPATSAPKGVVHAFLNQSGTSDGTVTTFLNSLYNSGLGLFTPTLTRHGVGVYRFNMSDRFPTGKTMPSDTLIIYNPRGRVEITLNGNSRYDILTFNTSGVASDGILVNHPMIINTYW